VISNYYTFRSLVSNFDLSIPGKRIREVYSQDADELAVAFHDDPRQLVFVCRTDLSAAYLHDGKSRARRNSVDLLEASRDARVDAVTIRSSDRVMYFALDTKQTLAAVLYGPRANVLLLDDLGTILDSFKNPKKLRGSTLHLPAGGTGDGFEALRRAVTSPESRTVVAAVRKSFPSLGGTLALESVMRAGFNGSLKCSEADSAAFSAVEAGIRSVLSDLEGPLPRVYSSPEGSPEYFSLIPLTVARGMNEKLFDDINRGIRFFIAGRGSRTDREKEKDSVIEPLRQQLEKGRRTLRAIEEDAREGERAGMYEQYGALLMAALPSLRKGDRAYETDTGGDHISIPLEPSLSPVQNAQRYFEKAKRAKAAAEESSRRMRELSARIGRIEKLLAGAEGLPPGEGGEAFVRDHARELDEVGLGPRTREKEQLPFRIFTVDGGFEVWAGKNGANNDLLTLRYAKPDDLWFHARGGSGSHVVLKVHSGKGDPGKRACEQAAAIAAYYSKMKTAGTVAVAMTEKRFVRKPRGAPPGTVMIEREKVIFARPALPGDGGH
jgi:predicted ribosome quality control (RQC) complex YloA/Tae2 family protein